MKIEKRLDDSFYYGELDDDNWACGEGIQVFRNGVIIIGTFREDKCHGFGIFKLKNGDIKEGCYHKGRRFGNQTQFK